MLTICQWYVCHLSEIALPINHRGYPRNILVKDEHFSETPFRTAGKLDCTIKYKVKTWYVWQKKYILGSYWVCLVENEVCEIVFAEVIDHRSRVKNIHHRLTVYTCRPVMLSSSKTYEITIDRWATRLDGLPSLTQFLPRSGPRSMGEVAHWKHSVFIDTNLHPIEIWNHFTYFYHNDFLLTCSS